MVFERWGFCIMQEDTHRGQRFITSAMMIRKECCIVKSQKLLISIEKTDERGNKKGGSNIL